MHHSHIDSCSSGHSLNISQRLVCQFSAHGIFKLLTGKISLVVWIWMIAVAISYGEPSDTGTTIRRFVAYTDAKGAESIAFHFDKEYQCGQYVNGEWWVAVDPETQTVVVEKITPDTSDGRNGWCVNPINLDKQPFDKRAPLAFEPSLTPSLPYRAHAGESLVKSVSAREKVGHSFVTNAAVLTIVKTPPDSSLSLFRPPYMGTYKPEFSANDLQVHLLPRLPSVADAISQQKAEAGLSIPRLDYFSSWGSAYIRPIEAAPSWGGDMARQDAEVFLWLCLDQPDDVKRKALIGLVQYGIDLFGAKKNLGTDWFHGGGGNGAGRLLPFVFAATLLNSEEMKAELAASVCDAPSGNTFWEGEMFYRSKVNGMVLWGNRSPYISEEIYWKGLAVDPNLNKASADFYGEIDGGSIPGQQYQGCVSLPMKYQSLVLRLIPQLQQVWPEEKIKIMEYADRIVANGVHTLPDSAAPAPKLSAEQWSAKEQFGYGKTWGPDPAHPGKAIPGEGRFPNLNGSLVDMEGFPPSRRSKFGDNMWNAYRGLARPHTDN